MLCRELENEEIYKVNDFYKLTEYKRIIDQEERVFVVESEGSIVGAVCIEKRENINVLRGMYILPELKGKKIGSTLLTFIEPFISESYTYCIPYRNLIRFYEQIGFVVIAEIEKIPVFLHSRCNNYLPNGLDVVIMHRVKN